MKEFLIIFGLVFGAAAVFFIYSVFIKDKLLKGKSVAGIAERVMKKDASSKYSSCKFYADHDYSNAYSQKEWLALYNEQVTSKKWDNDSEEYAAAVAPFVNAIVVEGKYYVRRGLENPSLLVFQPGINDKISAGKFIEPYEYVKDEKRAIVSKLEELERKKKAEEDAPRRAAYARCRNCIHEHNCDSLVKEKLGDCSGYIPKEKRNPFL